MEDQIEREQFCFIDEIEGKKYIYIYISDNSNWENYIIIRDKLKAIEYSKKYNCKIEIFSQIEDGIFTPHYKYYKNGEYFTVTRN